MGERLSYRKCQHSSHALMTKTRKYHQLDMAKGGRQRTVCFGAAIAKRGFAHFNMAYDN